MGFRKLIMIATAILCVTGGTIAQGSERNNADKPYVPLKKCWEYAVEGLSRSSVDATMSAVFFAEPEGRIRSLDLRSGSVRWVTELGGQVSSVSALSESGFVAVTTISAGERRSMLRLLAIDTGLVKHSIPIAVGENANLISDGGRLIVSDPGGDLFGAEVASGAIKWHVKLPARISASPVILNEKLIVATGDRMLRIVSTSDGASASAIQTDRNVTALAIRENGMIVAGDDRGSVTNYRDLTGNVWWRFKSGARVGTIMETGEGILVGSYDNFLYMVSKYNGDVKWKRRLDGRIISSPALLDDWIIAASSTEGNFQVIETQTGKPIDRVELGEDRFLLTRPFKGDNGITVFPLTNAITAYSPNGCPSK